MGRRTALSQLLEKKLSGFKEGFYLDVIVKANEQYNPEGKFKSRKERGENSMRMLEEYLSREGIEYSSHKDMGFASAKMRAKEIYKLGEQDFVRAISEC